MVIQKRGEGLQIDLPSGSITVHADGIIQCRGIQAPLVKNPFCFRSPHLRFPAVCDDEGRFETEMHFTVNGGNPLIVKIARSIPPQGNAVFFDVHYGDLVMLLCDHLS